MEFKEAFDKLKQSKEFKDWCGRNKGCFLSFAFCQVDNVCKSPWQFGFHNEKDETATSFIVSDSIEVMPAEKEFKQPDTRIQELDLKEAKLTYEQIISRTDEFQKNKYPKELVNKKIIILQNLKKYGNIWNITLITRAFNTINIKIDPSTGEVIDDKISSLLDLWQNK